MKGVVAAGHPVTAEAGAQVLREGGNAFDAAVCAVMASFVAESPLTSLGAGGFMLAHVAGEGEHLLDFFVEAGGCALDPQSRGELVPVEIVFDQTPQVFYVGPASCGVPGTVAGLCEAASRFGTMPFERLAAPAVRYAREGVRVTPEQAYMFTLLEPILCRQPEMAKLYAPGGNLLAAGDFFRFPAMGDALEAIAQEGAGVAVRQRRHPAAVRLDVRARRADVAGRLRRLQGDRASAGGDAYRNRRVLTNAPPSSGGVLIGYALALLERWGNPPPLADPNALALLAEVMAEAQPRARWGVPGAPVRRSLRPGVPERVAHRRGGRATSPHGSRRTHAREGARSARPLTSRCSTIRATRRA